MIRKFYIAASCTLIFLGVMMGNIFTSIEDSIYMKYNDNNNLISNQNKVGLGSNGFDGNISVTTKPPIVYPGEVGKIKWLSGMVMALDDNSFKQKYYLDLKAEIHNPRRSKQSQEIQRSKEELFATYLKNHNDIFDAPEAERSSPKRLPDDVIGERIIMFPLSSKGDISTAARELFKSSGVSLDDISGVSERTRGKHAAGSRLSVVFAVLSTPLLIYSRLLPLLTTSLRDQSSVHVFFRRTNISHLAVKEVNSQLKIFHDRFMRGSVSAPFDPERVKVVELDGPGNYYIERQVFSRNAWMNMQIIKYLGDHYSAIPFQSRAGEKSSGLEEESMQNGGRKDNPFSRWFCLVDDAVWKRNLTQEDKRVRSYTSLY